MEQRQELTLYRNSRGALMDFPENQGGCQSYAHGFQRHDGGTILAISSGRCNTGCGQSSPIHQNKQLKLRKFSSEHDS